jgi:hypothetical protein
MASFHLPSEMCRNHPLRNGIGYGSVSFDRGCYPTSNYVARNEELGAASGGQTYQANPHHRSH